jgi:hypothetical protein
VALVPRPAPPPAAAADTDRLAAAHEDTPASNRPALQLPSILQVQALLDRPAPRPANWVAVWLLAALLGSGAGVLAWRQFAPAAKPAAPVTSGR